MEETRGKKGGHVCTCHPREGMTGFKAQRENTTSPYQAVNSIATMARVVFHASGFLQREVLLSPILPANPSHHPFAPPLTLAGCGLRPPAAFTHRFFTPSANSLDIPLQLRFVPLSLIIAFVSSFITR